jgi:hypothetical protein
MRVALTRRAFAILRTWVATAAGKLTLCLTVLLLTLTIMHQNGEVRVDSAGRPKQHGMKFSHNLLPQPIQSFT